MIRLLPALAAIAMLASACIAARDAPIPAGLINDMGHLGVAVVASTPSPEMLGAEQALRIIRAQTGQPYLPGQLTGQPRFALLVCQETRGCRYDRARPGHP